MDKLVIGFANEKAAITDKSLWLREVTHRTRWVVATFLRLNNPNRIIIDPEIEAEVWPMLTEKQKEVAVVGREALMVNLRPSTE